MIRFGKPDISMTSSVSLPLLVTKNILWVYRFCHCISLLNSKLQQF